MLDSKGIKPVNLKGNQPKHLLEGLMLKLKLQYFGHLMQTVDSLRKSLMLGKIEGWRKGHRRMRWMNGTTDAMDMNLGKLPEMLRDREAWHTAVHEVAKSWMQLGNWKTPPPLCPQHLLCEEVININPSATEHPEQGSDAKAPGTEKGWAQRAADCKWGWVIHAIHSNHTIPSNPPTKGAAILTTSPPTTPHRLWEQRVPPKRGPRKERTWYRRDGKRIPKTQW